MFLARPIPKYNPSDVLSKIGFDDESKCWEWNGHLNNYGYGTYGKRNHVAHRVVYELLVADLSRTMTLDHLCLNKSCVNPKHLEVTSLRENVLRNSSPNAKNARKTHCLNGHEFTVQNTYIHPKRGHRQCKACRQEAVRRYLNKKKG